MRPSPVRLLGLGGLVAAALVAVGGFYAMPALVGVSGAVMLVANLYALLAPARDEK